MTRRTNDNCFAAIQDFRFGIEIEQVGLSARDAGQYVTAHLNRVFPERTFVNTGSGIRLEDGRVFNFVYDGSIGGMGCEMVSPILTHADMDVLQEIVRGMRKNGARPDPTCGIHVHVDAELLRHRITVDDKEILPLRNLIKIVAKNENLIYHSVGGMRRNCTTGSRSGDNRGDWCRPVSRELRTAANRTDASVASLVDAFYNDGTTRGTSRSVSHYNNARYRGLNLHNFCYRPNSATVEFRYFEPTLHAGKVKSFVQLVLALTHRARTVTKCSSKPVLFDAARGCYSVRKLCRDLRLTGEVFKTARHHLALLNLDGDSVLNRRAPAATDAAVETDSPDAETEAPAAPEAPAVVSRIVVETVVETAAAEPEAPASNEGGRRTQTERPSVATASGICPALMARLNAMSVTV